MRFFYALAALDERLWPGLRSSWELPTRFAEIAGVLRVLTASSYRHAPNTRHLNPIVDAGLIARSGS